MKLGRIDISHAASSLSRFSSGPREGHIARALRIAGYLKKRSNLELVHDPMEIYQTNNGRTANRKELMVQCHDVVEEIDSGLPPPKHKPLSLPSCYDSNLAYDRVTMRSMCVVVGMIGKTAIIHEK